MTKLFITFILIIVNVLNGFGQKGDIDVNVKESLIKWEGKKVTGQHVGTIQLKGGRLEMDNGKFLTGGIITMDMTTISNTDLLSKSKIKLENHLKSDDFFGIEKYPTSTFVISKTVPQGVNSYKIIGNMTIKGITKEIQFMAIVMKEGDGVRVTADITIDRSQFNVRYGSSSFIDNLGDKTIYDNFNLSVSIFAH